MKKIIYYLIASVFLMFILPWLAVTLVPNDAGMTTTVFLLFTVNPIYSIIVGVFAGKNVKNFMVAANCYNYHFLSRYMDIL